MALQVPTKVNSLLLLKYFIASTSLIMSTLTVLTAPGFEAGSLEQGTLAAVEAVGVAGRLAQRQAAASALPRALRQPAAAHARELRATRKKSSEEFVVGANINRYNWDS